jgi:hypothetical protein
MVKASLQETDQLPLFDDQFHSFEIEPKTIVANVREHDIALLGVMEIAKNLNKNIEFQEKIEDPRSASYFAIMKTHRLDHKGMAALKEEKEGINSRLNEVGREKFGEAYQEKDMYEAGWMTEEEAKDLTSRAFRAFKKEYFDPVNRGKLSQKMRDLRTKTGTSGRPSRSRKK